MIQAYRLYVFQMITVSDFLTQLQILCVCVVKTNHSRTHWDCCRYMTWVEEQFYIKLLQ